MRLICVILLISTLALLFHTTVADIDQDTDLSRLQQNDDDTSLFRGVENAIDEDSEDDAYRILKSLQDVRDDEMDEDQDFNPDGNEEEDEEEDSDLLFDEEDDEEDQDEDEDDFSAGLPEFKNEETADFFEHLPQQPVDNGDNKLSIVEDNIEVEEVDEEMDELAPKPDNGEEDDEEEEEEQDDPDQHNENSTPTPVLPPIINENIPWNRPEPVMKADENSNFYQDINYKESEKLKQNPSSNTSNFQFWHLFFILMVLAIVYNSITKRKPHNFIELPSSSSSSSLSWGNKDEKDYLPLHSNNKRNSYYKYEIKSS
ncbi:hypothetical protein MBANPS3_003893 [Mucor bainieri]